MLTARPCPRAVACSIVAAISAEASAPSPSIDESLSDAIGGELTPGRRCHRVPLRNEDRAAAKSPVPDLVQRQRRDIDRQLREGAGASNNPGLALEDRARPVESPTSHCSPSACPPPSQDVPPRASLRARSPPAARSASQRLARRCASVRALPAEHSSHPGLPGAEEGPRWLDRSRGKRPRPRDARRKTQNRKRSGRPRERARGRIPRVAPQRTGGAAAHHCRSREPRQRGREAVRLARPGTRRAAKTPVWPEAAAPCQALLPESSTRPR